MKRQHRLELERMSAELAQASADLAAVRTSSGHRHPSSTSFVDPVTGRAVTLPGRPLLDLCEPGCPLEPEQTRLFLLVDGLSRRLRALKHESAQAGVDLAKARGTLAAQGTAARQRKVVNRRKKVKAKAKGKSMPAKVYATDPAKTRTTQRDLRAIRGSKAR